MVADLQHAVSFLRLGLRLFDKRIRIFLLRGRHGLRHRTLMVIRERIGRGCDRPVEIQIRRKFPQIKLLPDNRRHAAVRQSLDLLGRQHVVRMQADTDGRHGHQPDE